MLSKEQILSSKRKTQIINVPDWAVECGDDEVLIGVISAKELVDYMQSTGEDDMGSMIKFCSMIILDPETKTRMFSDDDLDALGNLSMVGLKEVFEAGMKMHGLDPESVDETLKN